MGFAKLSKTQKELLLLLRHIRNTDRDLYDYIRTIRKMKKILPVICGNGDVQSINTTQVAGTTTTVGAVSSVECTNCDDCYSLPYEAMQSCIRLCAICDSANS
jgi:hypothetical protein